MRYLHWVLPISFLVVTGSCLTVLRFWGDRLPVDITNLLSLSLVPFLLFAPLLKAIGMTTGEYWAAPSPPGFVLVSAFYCMVLFGIGKAIGLLTRLSSR